jgi:hypothetical protein
MVVAIMTVAAATLFFFLASEIPLQLAYEVGVAARPGAGR